MPESLVFSRAKILFLVSLLFVTAFPLLVSRLAFIILWAFISHSYVARCWLLRISAKVIKDKSGCPNDEVRNNLAKSVYSSIKL